VTSKKNDFKHKVLKGFLWLGTGTFIGQLVTWSSTIIVIRLLEPSDYGLMAMAGTFLALFLVLSELGMGAAIIQAKTLSDIQVRQLFGLVILLSVFGWIAIYLTAPLVALFFNEERLIVLVRVIGIDFFIIALYTIPMSLLVRDLNFKSKAKVDLAAQVSGAIVSLGMAYNGMGVWSLIAGMLSIDVIKAFGYNIVVKRLIIPSFRISESIALTKYGLLLTGNRLLFYVFTQADRIIGGKLLGDVFLGIYSVALNLASIPAEKILPLVTQVTFASYSRIQDDIERINRNILRTIRVMAVLGFPLFWGMAGVAQEAIPLLLGEKWLSVVIPFQLFCLILPLKSLSFIFSPALFAIDKAKVLFVNMLITVSIMVSAFYVGAHWGVIGLTMSWVIAYPVVFVIITLRSLNALNLHWLKVANEILFPIMASITMLLFLGLGRYFFSDINDIVMLSLLVILGMLIYLFLIIVFKRNTYIEVFQDIFSKKSKSS